MAYRYFRFDLCDNVNYKKTFYSLMKIKFTCLFSKMFKFVNIYSDHFLLFFESYDFTHPLF